MCKNDSYDYSTWMLIANLAEKVQRHATTSKRFFEGASPKLGAIRVPTTYTYTYTFTYTYPYTYTNTYTYT